MVEYWHLTLCITPISFLFPFAIINNKDEKTKQTKTHEIKRKIASTAKLRKNRLPKLSSALYCLLKKSSRK